MALTCISYISLFCLVSIKFASLASEEEDVEGNDKVSHPLPDILLIEEGGS